MPLDRRGCSYCVSFLTALAAGLAAAVAQNTPATWLAAATRGKELRRGMEGSESCRQGRERNDLAEILERVQQAPEDHRLTCLIDRDVKKPKGVGESLCLADAL